MARFSERQTNTEEQMREYLETAMRVFNGSDFPADLRIPVFLKLCDWAAAKTLVQEPSLSDQWGRNVG